MTYVTSDWHIFKMPGGRRPSIDWVSLEIIFSELAKLTKEDTVIFLGDLMDDGIRLPLHGEFVEVLDKINEALSLCNKAIFVRGNNDDQSDNFYKACGFDEVVYAVTANTEKAVESSMNVNILFSHTSVDIHDDENWINIHGHIHRPNTDPDTISYYHDPSRCINICTADRRELRLTAVEKMMLAKELERNNTWSPGFEHSGMSTLCQNQAYQIYLDSHKGGDR